MFFSDDYWSLIFFLHCLKGKICMTDMESWRGEHDDESQRTRGRSADSVPDVQAPLGSSVMTPNHR